MNQSPEYSQEKALTGMTHCTTAHEAFTAAFYTHGSKPIAAASHFDRGIESLEKFANSFGYKLTEIEETDL